MHRRTNKTIFLLALGFFAITFISVINRNHETHNENSVLGETIASLATPLPAVSAGPEEIPTTTPPQEHETNKTPAITKLTPKPLAPQNPTVTTSKSGAITTLNFSQIHADTVYFIDLSSQSFDSFVLSWPNNKIMKWSFTEPQNSDQLSTIPQDEDVALGDTKKYSGIVKKPDSLRIYLMATSDITEASLSLLSPDTQPTVFSTLSTGVYNYDAGASYSSLPVVSRDTWGANPSGWDGNSSADIDAESRFVWNPVYYKAARIVVHHTATAPNYTTPEAAVRSIYLYHAYIRGWGDIGYNYLIDQNGTIYQGKLGGDETLGYHAFGSANQTSIGISLIGDFTYTTPTASTRSSLIALMAERAAFFGFTLKFSDANVTNWKNPTFTVFGHKSSYKWESSLSTWVVNNTACPGSAFYPQLPSLTQEAETYRQTHFAEIKQVVTEVDNSFAAQHDQGVIVVKYAVPNNTLPSVIESLLPKFSGITNYTISGNTVVISIESSIVVHPALGDSEYLVPPMGWLGYYNEFATYSPAFSLNGPEDRAKTLLKFFKMDPRVEAADVKGYYEIQE